MILDITNAIAQNGGIALQQQMQLLRGMIMDGINVRGFMRIKAVDVDEAAEDEQLECEVEVVGIRPMNQQWQMKQMIVQLFMQQSTIVELRISMQ